jgi:hypothetical protein
MELSMFAHLQFYLSNPLPLIQRASEPHPILGSYMHRYRKGPVNIQQNDKKRDIR